MNGACASFGETGWSTPLCRNLTFEPWSSPANWQWRTAQSVHLFQSKTGVSSWKYQVMWPNAWTPSFTPMHRWCILCYSLKPCQGSPWSPMMDLAIRRSQSCITTATSLPEAAVISSTRAALPPFHDPYSHDSKSENKSPPYQFSVGFRSMWSMTRTWI